MNQLFFMHIKVYYEFISFLNEKKFGVSHEIIFLIITCAETDILHFVLLNVTIIL